MKYTLSVIVDPGWLRSLDLPRFVCLGRWGRTWRLSFVRSGIVGLCVVALAGAAGCASPHAAADGAETDGPGGPQGRGGPAAVPAALEVPARARLRVSELEPSPAPPPRSSAVAPSARTQEALDKARALAAQQRFTEAALELERAARYEPAQPAIEAAMARIHWSAGNPERAADSARKAVEGRPDTAAAHFILGRVAAARDDFAAAVGHYRTALACSDAAGDANLTALAWYHLADALSREGYWTAALDAYDRFTQSCIGLTPETSDAELAILLRQTDGVPADARASLLERLGRYAEAAAELDRVVAAGRDDDALHLRRADLLVRAGLLGEALRAAQSVTAPSDEWMALLTRICERRGEPAALLDELRRRASLAPDDPEWLIRLADAGQALGRAESCVPDLEAFLRRHGDSIGVRLKLVALVAGLGDWSRALNLAGETIEQSPADVEEVFDTIRRVADEASALDRLLHADGGDLGYGAAYLLGRLSRAAGRTEDAARWFNRSLQVRPGFVPARFELGMAHIESYEWQPAMSVAARANPDVAEDSRLEYVLGRAAEGLDDVDAAELHFKAAVQLNRADVTAMFALAELYARSGRQLQAERLLQSLLEENPTHEQAREQLVMRYLATGQLAEAERQIAELTRYGASPTTWARCTARLELARTRDVDAYERTLLEGMKQGGEDVATLLMLGNLYGQRKNFDAARAVYQRALQLAPRDEDVAMRLVWLDYSELHFEAAAERLASLIPHRPNRHEWRLALIDVLMVIQDFDAALDLADDQERRSDLGPDVQESYRVAAAEVLRLTRRDEAWIQRLRSWAAVEGDAGGSWTTRLIAALLEIGRSAEALTLAESVADAAPQSEPARSQLLEALHAEGRTDRAVQTILDWLDADPDHEVTLVRMVRALSDAGRPDDALEIVSNELEDPRRTDVFTREMVGVLDDAERYDESARYLDALAAKGGAAAEDLHLMTAQRLILAERHADAERRLLQLLDESRDPREKFDVLTLLASSYEAQGQHDQSVQAYERALQLRPTDDLLNNNLGYLWADRGERLEEAERLIRQAVAESPRQASYLDSLGWVLYKKGDFAGAVHWLTRSARAEREADPVILDHLGDALWRAGRREEAVVQWGAAAETAAQQLVKEPDDEHARSVVERTRRKIEAVRAGRGPEIAPLPSPNAE